MTDVPGGTPDVSAKARRTALLRILVVIFAIVGTIAVAGSLRQLELGRGALERSRVALGLGDNRTAIEEAEIAASSYVPYGRYHRAGFERLMAIADDALGRADDDIALMAITSAKSAARSSPGASAAGWKGGDWASAIAERASRLHGKSEPLRTRTPIVVAEEPPPLRAYAWLGLAGLAYIFGVAFAFRRGARRPLSLAGLAMGIGALFFGIALHSV